jgi:uncharacterized RDD family membrane protein YckC
MQAATLDTVVSTETPEGILLELRPAGLAPRCYAFLLDWVIRIAVISIASSVAQFMAGFGRAAFFILIFALEWLYPVAFELSRWGATPGKRAFSLKVVMDSGLPITPAASLTRNLLRVADFLPAFFGFAVASMLMRRDFKRLGDIAAATLVVYQPLRTPKFALPQVELVQPALLLAPQDQAAVIALAARSSRLTRDRMDELAALAASVSGDAGRSGPEVTRRVLGVAQWLLGHR